MAYFAEQSIRQGKQTDDETIKSIMANETTVKRENNNDDHVCDDNQPHDDDDDHDDGGDDDGDDDDNDEYDSCYDNRHVSSFIKHETQEFCGRLDVSF
jgi:hypothetical protein